MRIFKSPLVAVLLSAGIVLASTMVSASARLKKDFQRVTDGFYQGVTYDGYKHPSIYSQLNNLCGAVDGMIAIAAGYDVDCSELSEASDMLKYNLSSMHDYIYSIYYDYSDLCTAISAFSAALPYSELSERDSEGISTYLKTVDSINKVIDSAGYNESVRQYISSMQPTEEFFADFCDLNYPESFS